MSRNQYNSKRVRTLTVDNLMPKSMSMGLKSAKYENIIRVRTLHVPLILLKQPLTIISTQQKLAVRFTDAGMVTTKDIHKELIRLLLMSAKYN